MDKKTKELVAKELIKVAKDLTSAGGAVLYVVKRDRVVLISRYFEQGRMEAHEISNASHRLEQMLKQAARKIMSNFNQKYNTNVASDVTAIRNQFMFQSEIQYDTDEPEVLAGKIKSLGIKEFGGSFDSSFS